MLFILPHVIPPVNQLQLLIISGAMVSYSLPKMVEKSEVNVTHDSV